VARSLRWTARRLQVWARVWHPTDPRDTLSPPLLEFHAEAGAPEGALFVDGQRIGVLPGVTRL
jgi:hypothetical protein